MRRDLPVEADRTARDRVVRINDVMMDPAADRILDRLLEDDGFAFVELPSREINSLAIHLDDPMRAVEAPAAALSRLLKPVQPCVNAITIQCGHKPQCRSLA